MQGLVDIWFDTVHVLRGAWDHMQGFSRADLSCFELDGGESSLNHVGKVGACPCHVRHARIDAYEEWLELRLSKASQGRCVGFICLTFCIYVTV